MFSNPNTLNKFKNEIGLDPALNSVGDVIGKVLTYLLPLAGIILLIYMIWGGFSLMLSRGDPKAIEAGKTKITNALIGFVILFIAYWLVQLLGLVLGVQQIQTIFP